MEINISRVQRKLVLQLVIWASCISYPYERRNAAAALQQFTFMVAQRLSVCKAVLVSR